MSLAVDASGLTFAYPNGDALFQDCDVSAPAGTLLCVTGRSGVGKSTLLYCLAGILPCTGQITLMGQLLGASASARAAFRLATCGFIFQRGELLPELSVLDNVALPLRLLGTDTREARKAAAAALERFDIEDCGDRAPQEISGGQAQRVSVARALIHRPPIVFADEPTASLDASSRDDVLGALRDAVTAGAAVVCASHDPALVTIADANLEMVDRRRASFVAS